LSRQLCALSTILRESRNGLAAQQQEVVEFDQLRIFFNQNKVRKKMAADEADPLGLLAGPSKEAVSTLFDDAAGATDAGNIDTGTKNGTVCSLRQVRADKFGGKSSVMKEKAKMQAVQQTAASRGAPKDISSPVSQFERGLGFSTVPELSSDSAGKLQKEAAKEVDILATLAASENKFNDVESSIFDALGVSQSSKNIENAGDGSLFGKKVATGVPRIGEKFGKNEAFGDLGTSKFLEKEEEDKLAYDIFGVSQTKQNIKKQTMKLKAEEAADESELDEIKHLKLEEDKQKAPEVRAVDIEIDPQQPAAEIADFDDVDAYIAKMAGSTADSGGGGGLFD
jgi:hypothetical protein